MMFVSVTSVHKTIRWLGIALFVLFSGSLNANPPQIDVWYGDSQSFGSPGIPQNWVNVLGTVTDPDGITSLTYSLNGGPDTNLSIGPDTRRLLEPGDFNIEIDFPDLDPGMNLIDIRTQDSLGFVSVKTVAVDYIPGQVWPSDYSTDWLSAASVTDFAQIVDGKWYLAVNGVRPSELGYDRTFVIGDMLWEDYEVVIPITMHSVDPSGFEWPSVSPGIGFTNRWLGHTTLNPGEQPHVFWQPSGGVAWYNYGTDRLVLSGSGEPLQQELANPGLEFDVTYIWKLRAQTTQPGFTFYGLKVWEQGTSEPQNWMLSGVDGPGDLSSGSLIVVSHHIDATFGDVEVTSLSNDVTPPAILNVGVGTFATGARITWQTDEPTIGLVRYGLTSGYELGVVPAGAFANEHETLLDGLVPGSTYHYQVQATDGQGNLQLTANDIFFFSGQSSPAAAVSDDFSESVLNPALWTFVNPLGDANVTMTGTQAAIAIPANGNVHDVWTGINTLPRISQVVQDDDFEVVAKFESAFASGSFKSQGMLFEEDDLNVFRVEFLHINGVDKLFVASIFDSPQVHAYVNAPDGRYLRVNRTGDVWKVDYSVDGASWVSVATVSLAMTVAEISIYAGSNANEAHTALVDYFFETSAPIVPEDGGGGPPPLSVDSIVLPAGTVGTAYADQTLTASGGTAPYTWSVVAGQLPPGLVLGASTGIISGVPTTTTESPFSFTVQVQDAAAASTTANLGIVVQSASAPVSAPDVVGQPQAAAETTLAAAGLTLGAVTTQSSAVVAAGNVISQSPVAGISVASGTAVSLVVSSGPAPVSVPDVVGQLQTVAETTLTAAGLTLGTVSTQSSTVVPAGNVISQSPAAGASVASGTAVALVVSSGPAPVPGNLRIDANPWTEKPIVEPPINRQFAGMAPTPESQAPTYRVPLIADDQLVNDDPLDLVPNLGGAELLLAPNGEMALHVNANRGVSFAEWDGVRAVSLGNAAWTIFLDVEIIDTVGSYPALISKRADSASGFWQLNRLDNGPDVNFAWHAGGNFRAVVFPNGWPGPGRHQVVLTRDNGNYAYYVDGEQRGQAFDANPVPTGIGVHNLALGVLQHDFPNSNRLEARYYNAWMNIYHAVSAIDVATLASNPWQIYAPTSLPEAAAGTAYADQTLTASGGTAPYTWSVVAGQLPPGLVLGATTGIISGVPTTTTGSPFNFTVQVQDAAAAGITADLSIVVQP